MRPLPAVAAALVLLPSPSVATAGAPAQAPPGFTLVARGPAGGTVWQGRIPNREVQDPRLADVYLPPGYSTDQRYPVIYFLHGFWGSPSSFVHGLHMAAAADTQIESGAAVPFIAVMPPGGPMTKRADDEWAGVWEDYVVRDVVPWVDERLPTDPSRRAIAGLSAGGFGAVDIGLRHPRMFRTLESWGGYFRPFIDGSFVGASRRTLDAHTPTLLVRREAAILRRRGVRFFLSTGRSGHGPVAARWTFEFADELAQLRLQHRLWILPPGHRGHLYRNQLPAAIDYAVPA